MNRRSFTKTIAALGGAAALTGIYSWRIEPVWLEFVKIKMPIQHLPEALHGKILMQISDIHVGAVNKQYLIKSLQKATEFNPDIVVYTGDFVTENSGKEYEELKGILKYRPLGKLGTIGILGNHDYGYNWSQPEVAEKVISLVNEAGITVLRNEKIVIGNLSIIGIDDYWGTNFYPKQAMELYNPTEATLVLSHNPDTCDLPVWNNYKGWILAGHTHGGQVKPPFLPAPIVPVSNNQYISGTVDLKDGRLLYINRALGYKTRLRFNVRPEITIFELETAS